jgi:hypothetical protein
MRRVFRIAFNAATVFSMFLCVGTAVMWARSLCVAEMIHAGGASGHVVVSGGGQLAFVLRTDVKPESPAYERSPDDLPFADAREYVEPRCLGPLGGRSYEALGVLLCYGPVDTYGSFFVVAVIPYWGLLVLGALLPVLRSRLLLRRRRRPPGACPACGYDLRATPDRCPECGTVPTAPAPRPGGAGG